MKCECKCKCGSEKKKWQDYIDVIKKIKVGSEILPNDLAQAIAALDEKIDLLQKELNGKQDLFGNYMNLNCNENGSPVLWG